MISNIQNQISKIKEGSIVCIDDGEDKMMFRCKYKDNGYILCSKDYGNYCTTCELDELHNILFEDFGNGLIKKISVHNREDKI